MHSIIVACLYPLTEPKKRYKIYFFTYKKKNKKIYLSSGSFARVHRVCKLYSDCREQKFCWFKAITMSTDETV